MTWLGALPTRETDFCVRSATPLKSASAAAPLLMLSSTPPSDEEIEVLFKQFDTSGDGYLSFEELMAALKKGGKDVSADEAIAIIAEVDENADGQIELSEFIDMFHLAPDKMPYGVRTLVDVSSLLLTPATLLVKAVSNVAEAIVETVAPKAAAGGGINDKAQQKKWANKRDEIRAKREAAKAAAAAASAPPEEPASTPAEAPAKPASPQRQPSKLLFNSPTVVEKASLEENSGSVEEWLAGGSLKRTSSGKEPTSPPKPGEIRKDPLAEISDKKAEALTMGQKDLDAAKNFADGFDDLMMLRFGKVRARMRGELG